MRVMTDLIEADGIIDTRELGIFDTIRSKYGIKKEDEVAASDCSLSLALQTLSASDDQLKSMLLKDFNDIAMSDDICAREEALLILAIRSCLTNEMGREVSIVSICADDLDFERAQILYVESEYDHSINEQINRCYREISAEFRLSGFDFVYLPQIAEHYKSIPQNALMQITSFLYPKVSDERLATIIAQLQTLSTANFCKEQLSAKFNISALSSVPPSLMVKIGNSRVDDKMMANFMLIEINDNVLEDIRAILDMFTESYHNEHIPYLTEEKGRFVFKGFYKQVFDILMLKRGIQSTVVIDTRNEKIYFPEADVRLEKIHRREKALYALLLLESASGGINFNKPGTPKQLERYNRRMTAVQAKYKMIYRMFGGDEKTAPNLEQSDIRLPMFSLLKRQILKLSDILSHANDYIIQRNIYGNYSINLSAGLCCCIDEKNGEVIPMLESETWQKIAAI